jgi:hypothetical protein
MRIILVFFCMSVLVFAWEFMGFGNETQKKEVVMRTVLPTDISYEKLDARSYLNSIREDMGLNTLVQNDMLNDSAQAHADYLVANHVSSHYETEGMPKFTGVKPSDRALYANYASSYVRENISTQTYSAVESIEGLFSAIYHRFGFLACDIDEIGVGVAQQKEKTSNSAFVYVMANSNIERLCHEKSFSGNGKYYYKVCKDESHRVGEKVFKDAQVANKRYNPEIVVYPYDGQNEVPPVFYDESPDPLPNYEVSGYPVSVAFNDYYYKKVKLLSFKLFENDNKEVTDVLLMDKNNDPHQRFTALQYALFPLKRLAYDAQYRVEVSYRVKGKVHTITWAFTTQKPMVELHTVQKNEATLHLKKGKSHMLYFPPHNAHDLLKNIQFPADVDIKFIDHNTLELTVIDESLDDFSIKSKDRTIHILMD